MFWSYAIYWRLGYWSGVLELTDLQANGRLNTDADDKGDYHATEHRLTGDKKSPSKRQDNVEMSYGINSDDD